MASEVERTAADDFFPGFAGLDVETGDVSFRGKIGGTGSPVLLLHGYPQTHVAWRLIAPTLAKSRTVIVPDLPGYGGSRTHNDLPRWTKRRVAGALVALMDRLGHERFAVVGHDRGARAGYRLALDHPQRVAAYVSLTVVPTLDAFAGVDMTFALDAYRTAFRNPDVRHAMCEDYRAAASEGLEHDASDFAAGRKLACPTLVLWSEREQKARNTSPIDTWSGWAANATGGGLPGGHLLPEDAPNEVLSALGRFLIDGF
ncbi:alpha/beta fold hydrolase [Burkholderia oklahomensis]|uniref:Fluoroacetate dehalogenase n=1 Tax=Burkholderia oklahomensis TaxID=342113 RepID=A0AAI8BBA4_9BURK|nr:alpha/beta hydrolase [Burkholderia oklahomensis]AIO68993.1 fluoroacetate dehalogenase [Burkholderia oklahomensis]AOI39644.1 hydrolase [Burkholderia oklahomensis EO147]KUY51574.1 hydrolase [Burkholderia oklahomensis EO147]QPS39999.1 alpha/beta fold hydrolase [Burkholderia oklahomensis]